MEEHRKWARETYQTLLNEGKVPQMAVMEVLTQAQATGNDEIAQAVLKACQTLPAAAVETAQ